jgi:hypothetical protein
MGMMNHRRNSPAALRFADRRRREDEAPKLRDEVQGLTGLRLEIEDCSGVTASKHVRRVMVDSAPALFLVPCVDPRCTDGEHDLTHAVMQALRSHKTSFQGTDECHGSLGPSPCPRVVRFEGIAEYGPAS